MKRGRAYHGPTYSCRATEGCSNPGGLSNPPPRRSLSVFFYPPARFANYPAAACLLPLRRELCQVVDAEFLFDAGDFVDHFFKTFGAEKLVFFLFKIFAERIVFVGRY